MIRDNHPKYDLAVAYRIYPAVSQPALGLPFGDDKYLLSETCLRSFKESLGSLRAKVWVLLDGCPSEYGTLVRKYVDPDDLSVLLLDKIGNRATFAMQIETLLRQEDSDLVYFAEDDYFYLPGQFHCMVDFLRANKEVHFVSPYDHLDCYTLDLHRGPGRLVVHGSHHWRTAPSTCLTFLTRRETLAQYASVFRSYANGNDDCALWLSITKHRVFNPLALVRYLVQGLFYWKILVKAWLYGWRQIVFGRKLTLWVPVPAIATHLARNALSPTVDWIALLERKLGAEV